MNVHSIKRPFIIHPFLFTLFPILFLFCYNIEQISFFDTLLPLAISLGFTFLIIILLRLFIRNYDKATIIATLFLIAFFSYGHIYSIIRDWKLSDFLIGRHRYLISAIVILVVWGVVGILKIQKDLCKFTKILNIVAVILMTFSLVTIAVHEFKTINAWKYSREKCRNTEKNNLQNLKNMPDIYYIILDSYASLDTLRELYGYDNSAFIDYLTQRGFYIATDSMANYASSVLSIGSSLNMQYFNWLSGIVGEDSKDLTIPYQMIQDSRVVRELKSLGYIFIHFGTSWKMKNSYKFINQSFKHGIIDEFQIILIQTTFLRPLFDYFFIDEFRRQEVLWAFERLSEIQKIDIKDKKFVFVHIACPHPPFVFGPNGEALPFRINKWCGNNYQQKKDYLNQLIFVNKNVEKLIDEIFAKSKTKPIIILQSDHGPASTFPSDVEKWSIYPTENMVKERMRIFNAYYFPASDYNLLYRSLTPVNTFRIIFKLYFEKNYELLENKSYYSTYKYPYEFIDVTDMLHHK